MKVKLSLSSIPSGFVAFTLSSARNVPCSYPLTCLLFSSFSPSTSALTINSSTLWRKIDYNKRRSTNPHGLHSQQGFHNQRALRSLSSSSSEDILRKSSPDSSQQPILPPIGVKSKRLFLVRHGEVINPGGVERPVYYGAMDVSLSSLGELEAKAASIYLQQHPLQYVAASPLKRAMFGANQVLEKQKLMEESILDVVTVLPYDGFKELERGSWCGKTKGEIGEEMMKRFDACDESATPEGGESYQTLKQRVLEARDQVLQKTDCGKASAIVSHLQVTRSMLSDAMGIPIEEMSRLNIATASVTCIDYDMSSGDQTVHFQSFKPDAGLEQSVDGAN